VTDATNVPPGWYPDANAPGGQRWWDGTQWTEHVQGAAAYQPFQPLKAPEGTKTNTVWIWLIVFLPLLSMASIFLIDIEGYMRDVLQNPTSPGSMFSIYTSPGFLITTFGSWVLYGVMVVFAVLDWRTLKARGVPQPFHWAFAFLSIVYPIGRAVVVKRRTGSGLGPLWGVIIVYAVSLIVSLVWSFVITAQIMSMMPSYVYP
jgi:hypothetical protein